jgi:transposase-like protein
VDGSLKKSGVPLVPNAKAQVPHRGEERIRLVRNPTSSEVTHPASSSKDVLTDLLREGAQKLLAAALQAEVAEFVDQFSHVRDERGRRMVVRNGFLPERMIQTGIGLVPVQQPRVNDRRVDENGERVRFSSLILPRYMRRTKSLDELIPWLYLKGISTGDFSEALAALLGKEATGLSAANVVRLKQGWETEFEAWGSRSLIGKRYVYFWVDGIYASVRLTDDRPCILVVMGATAEGRKELVAVQDGIRESEQSWLEVLLDLKNRGLEEAPHVAVGDGALGFWKAIRKVFPKTRCQRCWVHKTANVLNNLPKNAQVSAKKSLQQIWMAETAKEAERAFDRFGEIYRAKYPKAVECLEKDRQVLLTFYDFPAEHWIHLRTTNPIESTFATVRLRTDKTKGAGSRVACLTMVWKLAEAAERRWRALNGGSQLLADVIAGVRFMDGTKEDAA